MNRYVAGACIVGTAAGLAAVLRVMGWQGLVFLGWWIALPFGLLALGSRIASGSLITAALFAASVVCALLVGLLYTVPATDAQGPLLFIAMPAYELPTMLLLIVAAVFSRRRARRESAGNPERAAGVAGS